MNAEIIAVGSEMLTPFRLDTNSLFLTRELNQLGIDVVRKSVLGDDRARLTEALREALDSSPLVLVTGGLGPTEDDLTRECAADALGIGLHRDDEATEHLRQWFARRGSPMAERNLRQTMKLDGAELLANGMGTAPGQWLATAGRILVLLPGPPRELHPMFEQQVLPRLRPLAPPVAFFTRVLRIADRGESSVDEAAAPIYRRYQNPQTTILASQPHEIELHFRASAATAEEARRLADEVAEQVAQQPLLAPAVFSRDNEPMEAVVGALLQRRNETVAVAESCTGGMLGERITAVAGSSAWFTGGVQSYQNAVKIELLGVSPLVLKEHGAVSEATARQMAEGVRRRLDSDWGVSITGIAGPGGGSPEKPVGTVYIAVTRRGGETLVMHRVFWGERERIRRSATQVALDRLRLALQAASHESASAQP
jgi:nicotinamide-nucleotide amidase